MSTLMNPNGYTDCYVAFIDILGFKNFIEKNDDNFDVVDDLYKRIENISQHIISLRPEMFTEEAMTSIKYCIVSDTIFVAIPKKQKKSLHILLMFVNILIYPILYYNNLLFRGAISEGNFYINNGIAFGSGIVRAAKLEKELAIYPRVIFTPGLLKSYFNDNNNDETYIKEIKNLVKVDPVIKDSLFIADYMGAFISIVDFNVRDNVCSVDKANKIFATICQNITEFICKFEQKDIREKYIYFANYYNFHVSRFKNNKKLLFDLKEIDVSNILTY